MSRDIKFRAWDKKNKVWMLNIEHMKVCEHLQRNFSFSEVLLNSHMFIPMQYTGLKDKNGKEIYENDIVLCKVNGISNIYAVSYRECYFYPFGERVPTNYAGTELEILGNIHEATEDQLKEWGINK